MGRRLRPRELLALDVLLAVALALLCGFAALEVPEQGSPREPQWLSWLVGAAIGGPVAVRRRWPVTAAAIVTGASGAALLSGVLPIFTATVAAITLACVFYQVGTSTSGRRSVLTVTAITAALGGVFVWVSPAPGSVADVGGLVFAVLSLVAAWVLGRATRDRRAYAARAEEARTERAVADERLRIARELHDIVAHSMSLIAVKAAVADYVAADRPHEVRDALRVIEATSRGALTDMRRTLGMLRETAPADATDLATLAERTRSAGVPVDLSVDGDLGALPEGVGRAVHRIVQESLTNVLKHATPAACRVTVVVDARSVLVEVLDDGTRTTPATAGQGLLGMRERVNLHSGEFAAGPRPAGGFAVTARLPLGQPLGQP